MKHLTPALVIFASLSAAPLSYTQGMMSGPGLGLIPNNAYTQGDIDSVNISNQNLVVDIPLVSLPQRGKLPPLTFSIAANSQTFQEYETCDPNDFCVTYNDYTGATGAPWPTISSNVNGTAVYNTPTEYDTMVQDAGDPYEACSNLTGDPNDPYWVGCAELQRWYWSYSVPDNTGAIHNMLVDSAYLSAPPYVIRATDGSGYSFVTTFPVTNPWNELGDKVSGSLYDTNGVSYTETPISNACQYGCLQQTTIVKDPSGQNSISYYSYNANPASPISNSNPGSYYVDSLNRTIQDPNDLVSNALWQYDGHGTTGPVSQCPNLGIPSQPALFAVAWSAPGPNGSQEPYVFCYTFVLYHTGFYYNSAIDQCDAPYFMNCDGDTYYTPVTVSYDSAPGNGIDGTEVTNEGLGLQAVVLPNGKSWKFVYDSAGYDCCGATMEDVYQTELTTGVPVTYGDIIEIQYPTGAKIDYTHENIGPSGAGASATRGILARTVSDGNGGTSTTAYAQTGVQTFYSEGYTCPSGNTCAVETSALGTPLQHDTMHVFTWYVTDTSVYDALIGGGASGGPAGGQYETQDIQYSGTAGNSTVLQTTATQYQSSPLMVPGPGHYVSAGVNVDPLATTISASTPAGTTSTEHRSYAVQFTGNEYYCYFVGYSSGASEGCLQDAQVPNVALHLAENDSVTDGSGNLLRNIATTYQYQNASAYASANMFTLPYSVTVTGPGTDSSETIYGYDENNGSPQGVYGNQTSMRQVVNSSGSTLNTSIVYNNQGMPTSVVDPRGNTTTTIYDGTGIFPSEIQHPTTNGIPHNDFYSYDANTGHLLYHTDWNGSGANDPAHTTTYTYNDPLGRLTQVTYPPTQSGQGQVNLSYNDSALTVTATTLATPDPTITASEAFDGLGRIIQTTAANGATSETTYDALGRVASVTNPHFTSSSGTDGTTKYTYDALGRMLTEILPDSTSLEWSYNGTTTTATDESGNATKLTTDGLGQLIQVVEPGSLTTNYTYDGLGNLLTVGQLGNGTTDTPRNRTFYYDMLSRLTSAINPETGTASYTYSMPGSICAGDVSLPCSKTDSRSITIDYSYDALNRPTLKNYSGGSVGFGYDGMDEHGNTLNPAPSNPNGMLTRANNEVNAAQNYSYDAMGRLTKETYCTPQNCSYDNSVQGVYDVAGSLDSLTYPDGNVATQGFDAASRLTSVKFGTGGGTNYVTVNAFDPVSHVTSLTMGNEYTMAAGYNSRMEIGSLSYASPSSTVWARQYTWTPNGNLQQAVNSVNGTTRQYTNDALSRITAAQDVTTGTQNAAPGGLGESFSYDSFGNMYESGNFSFQPTSYSVQNQPLPTTDWHFDAAGNLLSDWLGNAYTWDAEGRVETANGVNYAYDAGGDRVGKLGSSPTDYFYFNGEQVARLTSGAWTDLVYGTGGLLAEVPQGGSPTYRLTDHLGSGVATVSGTVAIQDYAPFGQLFNGSATSDPYKFTGKEWDSESGNDYLGARYYGSSMGRFISPDPSQLYYANPMYPQSLNLYSYVTNNPLIFTDPNGLDCIYTSNQTSRSVTVTIKTGDCNKDTDNGVFVDGTVDPSSIHYYVDRSNGDSSLEYTVQNDDDPNDASVGVTALDKVSPPNTDGLIAPSVQNEFIPTVANMDKAFLRSIPVPCGAGGTLSLGFGKNRFGVDLSSDKGLRGAYSRTIVNTPFASASYSVKGSFSSSVSDSVNLSVRIPEAPLYTANVGLSGGGITKLGAGENAGIVNSQLYVETGNGLTGCRAR